MKQRWGIAISLLIVLCVILSSSVFAFQDINNNPDKAKIESLKDRGIINGFNSKFNPDAQMTYAEGFQLIVKALNLNIDHIRFIKMPLASDYFSYVSDDAWYANAFLMAQFHLEPPADVQPNQVMTREVFAHYLFKGMMTKGEFAFIQIYMLINDEDLVTPEYMNAIQKLLISKVAQLDADNNFRPNVAITRGEAAVMIYNALDFLSKAEPIPPLEPIVDKDVQIAVEKVNDDVNKVTVTWGKKPNPGYSITIDRVEFNENGTASIVYSTHNPDPDKMYAQVITEPKAITYVASQYEAVLKANLDLR
ncbi:MAG: S-layer homology domain-containing protein [Paenibacillaceae bacterium]